MLKLVVIERHKGTGNIGRGFASGFGMQRGAIGTSVAHDSHNIVVVGADDRDINVVAQEIARMGGGLAAANGGTVQARLPLPIAGLLSPEPVKSVAKQVQALEDIAKSWGCTLPAPFAALSFLALPVIPQVRVTDMGVVDVERFEVVG
jgi:adenine deaminase